MTGGNMSVFALGHTVVIRSYAAFPPRWKARRTLFPRDAVRPGRPWTRISRRIDASEMNKWVEFDDGRIIPGLLSRGPGISCWRIHAPVAQLDRAADFGSTGWGFDSLRARLGKSAIIGSVP